MRDGWLIVLCLILIFVLGTYLFSWKIGLGLLVGIHLIGVVMLLVSFLSKPYNVTVTDNKAGKKITIHGFKRILFFLFFSFIWEYLIVTNSFEER